MSKSPTRRPNPSSPPTQGISPHTPQVVAARRLKELFVPAYLTLISIVQGVALSMLAGLVEAGYAQFDAVTWVLVVVTLISYVAVWNEYVQGIATYVFIPNLSDALVPFTIAALELLLAHFAVQGASGLRGYVLIYALTCFAAAGAFVQLELRIRSPRTEADSRDVHRALALPRVARVKQSLASGTLTLALWAAVVLLGWDRYGLIVALAVGAVNLAFLLGSVPYWNHVLAYTEAA